jgi:hypothetical protein
LVAIDQNATNRLRHKPLKLLARPKRFELLTPRFVVWCSIQLSYGRRSQANGRDGGIANESPPRMQARVVTA